VASSTEKGQCKQTTNFETRNIFFFFNGKTVILASGAKGFFVLFFSVAAALN